MNVFYHYHDSAAIYETLLIIPRLKQRSNPFLPLGKKRLGSMHTALSTGEGEWGGCLTEGQSQERDPRRLQEELKSVAQFQLEGINEQLCF